MSDVLLVLAGVLLGGIPAAVVAVYPSFSTVSVMSASVTSAGADTLALPVA